MRITDVHTHSLRHNAIVAVSPGTELIEGYIYSSGIHPWNINGHKDKYDLLIEQCSDPRVTAVGECGLDALADIPMDIQKKIFICHIEISESLRKPMIIHCVRAHEQLIAIHRQLKPSQPWIIHGFRQKPAIAGMMLDHGLYLSSGLYFNPETINIIPSDKLLIETDDNADADIRKVAATVAEKRLQTTDDILDLSASNINRLFFSDKTCLY